MCRPSQHLHAATPACCLYVLQSYPRWLRWPGRARKSSQLTSLALPHQHSHYPLRIPCRDKECLPAPFMPPIATVQCTGTYGHHGPGSISPAAALMALLTSCSHFLLTAMAGQHLWAKSQHSNSASVHLAASAVPRTGPDKRPFAPSPAFCSPLLRWRSSAVRAWGGGVPLIMSLSTLCLRCWLVDVSVGRVLINKQRKQA